MSKRGIGIECPHCEGVKLELQPHSNIAVCPRCGCNFTVGREFFILGGVAGCKKEGVGRRAPAEAGLIPM